MLPSSAVPEPRPSDLESALALCPLLPVLRYGDGAPLRAVIDTIGSARIPSVEVTADSPDALDHIAYAAERHLVSGLGTVTQVSQVADCSAAGGTFVVSPSLDPDVVRAALDRGLTPMPGVLTPGEAVAARRAGAPMLKLFPAGPLGPSYLRALLGPLAGVSFVVTGGIEHRAVTAWLEAGAAGVGLGRDVFGVTLGGEPDTSGLRQTLGALVKQVSGSSRHAAAP